MIYQVLGRKRKLKEGDKVYDVVCEFNDLVQLFYMMDKVNAKRYSEILVVNKENNECVASRELEYPEVLVKKRVR